MKLIRIARRALLVGLLAGLVATMIAAVSQPTLAGTAAYVLLIEVPLVILIAIVAGAEA